MIMIYDYYDYMLNLFLFYCVYYIFLKCLILSPEKIDVLILGLFDMFYMRCDEINEREGGRGVNII